MHGYLMLLNALTNGTLLYVTEFYMSVALTDIHEDICAVSFS